MKTHKEIVSRLKKLRSRYLKKYCDEFISKKPHNCIYNYEYKNVSLNNSIPVEFEIFPRSVTSLVVIQDDKNIRLCTYGSENCELWNGDICDSEDVSKFCPYFKSKLTYDEVVCSFNELMKDDKYVLENYKDIASLQWVIDYRLYTEPLTLMDKIAIFIVKILTGVKIHKSKSSELPSLEGVWDDDNAKDT